MITKKIIPTTGGFYYTSPFPLVADDVQAYEVVLNTTYDLTGATVRATATRADGAKIDDIVTVEGNTAKYILKNNMYSKVGTTILRLTLISEDGSVLTTKELSFEVVEGNGDADLSGDDRLPVLTQLIVDTGEAKAGANAAANYANEQGDYAKGVADDLDAKSSFISRSATIKVAASNATAKSKAAADYVCDGVDDHVEINAAIQELAGVGGSVELSEGTFNFTGGNFITLNINNVWLKGQGNATVVSSVGTTGVAVSISEGIKAKMSNLVVTSDRVCLGNGGVAHVVDCTFSITGSFFAVGNIAETSDMFLLGNRIQGGLFTNSNIRPATAEDLQKVNIISSITFM